METFQIEYTDDITIMSTTVNMAILSYLFNRLIQLIDKSIINV